MYKCKRSRTTESHWSIIPERHNRPLRATPTTTLPIISPSAQPFMYKELGRLFSLSALTLSNNFHCFLFHYSQRFWAKLTDIFLISFPHETNVVIYHRLWDCRNLIFKCGYKTNSVPNAHASHILTILNQHLSCSYKPIWNAAPFMKSLHAFNYLPSPYSRLSDQGQVLKCGYKVFSACLPRLINTPMTF